MGSSCGKEKSKYPSLSLTAQEELLYSVLSDRSWYSYTLSALLRDLFPKSKSPRDDLMTVVNSLTPKLQIKDKEEKINIFMYEHHEFIGLESRRKDYENDKANKSNFVENLIQDGHYKKKD